MRIPGNDAGIPGMRTPGNDAGIPVGNTPLDGSSPITIVPNPVCGPTVTKNHSMLPTTDKVVAVLYMSKNFASASSPQSTAATFIQAWDSAADIVKIRSQLASNSPIQFNLNQPLAAGTYTVVLYDASKVKAPYSYNWSNSSSNVVAPIMDSVAKNIDYTSTFVVNNLGQQKRPQVMNVLVGLFGDALCEMADTVDPLLLQLNTITPQPIVLTAPEDGVMFDLLGRKADHKKVQASWFATAKTENYFLVLPDAKGQVNGIDELFGDATFGPDRRYAKQGFHALAKYDDSGDRIISSDDEVFSKLRLWKDDNLDGVAQANELSTLDNKEVVAIDLRYDKRFFEKDQYGNMTKFKSVVVMKDESYGLVYDLWLRYINK
jgi:hypothetical protein